MSVRALARRAGLLHAAEAERWRDAWGAFWDDVRDAEPDAADALAELVRVATDAELDALADGTAPVLAEARAVAERWQAELDDALGPDPDAEAWAAWSDTPDALPRSPEPADLSLWPTTTPAPPPDSERTQAVRAFLRSRLAAAAPAERLAAAHALEFLAVARVLARQSPRRGDAEKC